ncbi:MAG: DUF924 domain-containing protein [Gammaproteobacteria bacterium]|nr:DUF924 domain-containing protein [Gammaproteobacteria bacterium]MCW8988530.1 DUF924 domain-containing protein [Gammaproteobacteria bacterium]
MNTFLTDKSTTSDLITAESITAESIIDFWYSDRIKSQWFNSTKKLDQEIKDNYEAVWKAAIRGEFNHWKGSAQGCLALAIILDQFPLNMYRGEVESFSTEAMAIKISKHAIDKGFDEELGKDKIAFLYMPLMHSEDMDDQNLSVSMFEKAGLDDNARFAKHHRGIVQQFGRFPHRNEILQRESSQSEIDYLNSDKAFTG